MLALVDLLDRVVSFFGKLGAWCALLLVIVVVYDVITRYAGVPKPFGLNSTQIQESEYWLHAILFSLMIGYAYLRQAHVRIDLVRERLQLRSKFFLEMFGCIVFLLPYSMIGMYYTSLYVHASYLENEISKSVIGLSHIWILKSSMPIMFLLLFLAGLAQLMKSILGAMGKLPDDRVSETLGGDL